MHEKKFEASRVRGLISCFSSYFIKRIAKCITYPESYLVNNWVFELGIYYYKSTEVLTNPDLKLPKADDSIKYLLYNINLLKPYIEEALIDNNLIKLYGQATFKPTNTHIRYTKKSIRRNLWSIMVKHHRYRADMGAFITDIEVWLDRLAIQLGYSKHWGNYQ